MASAKNKLFFHILLILVAAQDSKGMDMSVDGDEIKLCEGPSCQRFSSAYIDNKFGGMFTTNDKMEEECDPIPVNRNGSKYHAPVDQNCTAHCCPWGTRDNKDRCCHTCHYFAHVPYVIKTKDGPCFTFSLCGRYQFMKYGFCKDPGAYCVKPYCEGTQWYVNKCKQQRDRHLVLCVKFGLYGGLFLEPFWHDAYCACNDQESLPTNVVL